MPPARRKTQDQNPKPAEDAGPLQAIAEEAAGKSLHYKIGLVQHNVAAVDKTGKVDFGEGAKRNKYDHMQEHGLIGVLRDLLEAVKVGYYGGCVSPSWTQNGNIWAVDYALTVFDMESDAEITRYYPNVGVDSSDKGLNKAYTGASKYALQKFFSIPTQGLPEQEQGTKPDIPAEPATAQAKSSGQVPEKDINELRTLLANQDSGFIAHAMNKVKTYGVDRLEQMSAKQFMEFGNWVENSVADASAASE